MDGEDLISPERVRQGLATRFVGQQVLYLPVATSTMDVGAREAEAGCPEGTLVIAEEQTAGRGRFQRTWVSPPRTNLYFSLVFYPSLEHLAGLNMATAVAVLRAAQRATGGRPRLKWPNDVRFQGRKCAGILLETSVGRGQVRSAVLGIGVNINSSPTGPPDLAAAATSLAQEAGHAISRLAVLRDILQELEALYLAVQEGAPVWQEWAGCLETLGSYVHVRWREKVEEGVAEAVDRDGNLVLLRKDGSRVVLTAGEVTLQQHSPFGIAPE